MIQTAAPVIGQSLGGVPKTMPMSERCMQLSLISSQPQCPLPLENSYSIKLRCA